MLLSHRERFHLDSFRMVLSLQASVDLRDTEGNTGVYLSPLLLCCRNGELTARLS